MTEPTPQPAPQFARDVRTEFLPIIVRRDPNEVVAYLNEHLSSALDAAILIAALGYLSATFQRIEAGHTDALAPDSEGVGEWEISGAIPDGVAEQLNADGYLRTATMIHLLTLNQDGPAVSAAIIGAISASQQHAVRVIDACSALVARSHARMHQTLRRPGLSDTYCGCGLPGFLE